MSAVSVGWEGCDVITVYLLLAFDKLFLFLKVLYQDIYFERQRVKEFHYIVVALNL